MRERERDCLREWDRKVDIGRSKRGTVAGWVADCRGQRARWSGVIWMLGYNKRGSPTGSVRSFAGQSVRESKSSQ